MLHGSSGQRFPAASGNTSTAGIGPTFSTDLSGLITVGGSGYTTSRITLSSFLLPRLVRTTNEGHGFLANSCSPGGSKSMSVASDTLIGRRQLVRHSNAAE